MATYSRKLAPPGTTGNNTHTLSEAIDSDRTAVQINVTTAGTTATYTLQGSMDGTNWFNLSYVTDASSVEATAAVTFTTAGSRIFFVSKFGVPSRFWRFVRVVVSANTGQAYDIDMVWQERPE
jgi:hypothetical protein